MLYSVFCRKSAPEPIAHWRKFVDNQNENLFWPYICKLKFYFMLLLLPLDFIEVFKANQFYPQATHLLNGFWLNGFWLFLLLTKEQTNEQVYFSYHTSEIKQAPTLQKTNRKKF